jgi:S1-C subfamily serine protease
MRYWLAAALLIGPPASADIIRTTYSSGTGFFVSRDGYILTNSHVVEHCAAITVVGAVPMSDATLVARDTEHDLALLKTDARAGDDAKLGNERQPLRVNDPVVIVGYPGQSWKTGRTQTRQAHILSTAGPDGEEKWLEFSDALAGGNSGGPLLDGSGTVVGVVAAKARRMRHNEQTAQDETVDTFDLAVSLPVVRAFLSGQGVRFEQADSGIYLSADHITEDAQRFVVNVRCRYEGDSTR